VSDESVRQQVMTEVREAVAAAGPDRHLIELDRVEAMALLAASPYGRIVFTQRALPAIRPVNHVLDGDDIIIRTRLSAAVGTAVARRTGIVVAYQADEIDMRRRLGWSVVATGYAAAVTDPEEIARFERLLTPWVDMSTDLVIRIRPEIVTGFRLVAAVPLSAA
jgi:nitroimidazol reductase NimA-like FMN-containing flavoprotein (pyridoxamine 5'-phosphate oxidase superfamily)